MLQEHLEELVEGVVQLRYDVDNPIIAEQVAAVSWIQPFAVLTTLS